MRILYHHRTRGTDAQRLHINEMVGAFRQLGHEVHMVSLIDTETISQQVALDARSAWWQKFVRTIPFGYEAVQLGYNLVGLPLLLAKLLMRRVDVIYERYSLFNFAGVLAARFRRVPLVLEVNSPFALEQERDRYIRAVRLANWTERWICNAASKVIVVSNPLRGILIKLGVEPTKIFVMPNGVNLKHFGNASKAADLRRSLGVDGRTVIGFVGWFRRWHRLDLLLEAFEQANRGRWGVMLLLIGDGPDMPVLRQYVRRKNLEHSVVFTGAQPHEEVPMYLNLIDIAVQPAANEYCCPMKILEYMALGKPIIAPRQQNIEDLVKDSEQALLFRPGDVGSLSRALRKLVANPKMRDAIGEKAFQHLLDSGFLWTRNAEAVVRMFAKNQPIVSGTN